MQHWYVFHSKTKMRCSYSSLGETAAYSSRKQPKLLLGDVIWIVEGPGEFQLVDCFVHSNTDYPPLQHPFAEFALKAKGSSLLKSEMPLDDSFSWFKELRTRFITKQRFFARIEAQVVDGLIKVSGVSLR